MAPLIEINYDTFQTQTYLKPGSGMSSESMKWIFVIRSRDLAIRGNFPNSHKNVKCVIRECSENIESQRHIFSCPFLAPSNEIISNDISYDDIFGNNVTKQCQVMEIMRKRYSIRNEYVNNCCNDSPLGPGANPAIKKAKRSRKKKKVIQHK